MEEKILIRVKKYLRFDENDSDCDYELNTYIKSAKNMLLNAGVNDDNTDLYYQIVCMIVAQWHENRLGESKENSCSIAINSLVTQLAMSQRGDNYEY